jgi:hypothetical protein
MSIVVVAPCPPWSAAALADAIESSSPLTDAMCLMLMGFSPWMLEVDLALQAARKSILGFNLTLRSSPAIQKTLRIYPGRFSDPSSSPRPRR